MKPNEVLSPPLLSKLTNNLLLEDTNNIIGSRATKLDRTTFPSVCTHPKNAVDGYEKV